MPNYTYRALTQSGEMVSGLISASTTAEVARRIEYLHLFPIDTVLDDGGTRGSRFTFAFAAHARPEDVTIFTLDLALALKAGARLDEALELLATDIDIGRLRSTVAKIRSSVLAGESFADALSHHQALFSAMYVALVRIGETSGTLERILAQSGRSVTAKTCRCIALPGIFVMRCYLRSDLLSHIRDAAIWWRSSRFWRQARSGSGVFP
jgi:general secretion pathway protein F